MTSQDQGGSQPANPTSGQGGSGATAIASWKSPALWVGIGVLGLFIGLVIWTIGNRADTNWDRIVFVFGSVEAIAFAAAGAIFGTQVQRQQTQQAQQQANQEKVRADATQGQAQEHAVRAAKGESLAAAVKAAARGAAAEGVQAGGRGLTGTTQTPVLQQLAAIADGVLPD